jgi:hypothetical protein
MEAGRPTAAVWARQRGSSRSNGSTLLIVLFLHAHGVNGPDPTVELRLPLQ